MPSDSTISHDQQPVELKAGQPASHRIQSADGSLSATFIWQRDRYQHVVQRTMGVESESFSPGRCVSQEGTAEDTWPVSPALQQLSTELIDGVETILGVGCSGSSHFSVSVQVREPVDGDEGGASVCFDWAVRVPVNASSDQPAAFLGSTYELDASGNGDAATWQFECGQTATFDGKTASVAGKQIYRVLPVNGIQSDGPANSRRLASHQTVQWAYRIR